MIEQQNPTWSDLSEAWTKRRSFDFAQDDKTLYSARLFTVKDEAYIKNAQGMLAGVMKPLRNTN